MLCQKLKGSTIKPLVNLLNIDKASSDQRTLMAELNESFFESLTAGVRLVADSGQAGFPEFFRKIVKKIFPSSTPGKSSKQKDDNVTSILHLSRAHIYRMFRKAVIKLFEWLFSRVLTSHRGGPSSNSEMSVLRPLD